ncbi:MAG: zinc ABC transporter substrate-binding protein [Thermoproteota archaeon]
MQAVALALLGIVAAAAGSEGLLIVTSFPSLAEDVKMLACPGDVVASLAPAGVDPHELQLTPEAAELLQRADIVVTLGHTPLEKAVGELASSRRLSAVVVSVWEIPGIELRANPATGSVNYHMPTYDPNNYKRFVMYLAQVMGALRPECAERYLERAAEVVSRVDSVTSRVQRVDAAAVLEGPELQYAVEWTGLRPLALLVREHDSPARPEDVARAESLLAQGAVAVVGYPLSEAGRTLVELAKKYGAAVIYVPSPVTPQPTLAKIEAVAAAVSALRVRSAAPSSSLDAVSQPLVHAAGALSVGGLTAALYAAGVRRR